MKNQKPHELVRSEKSVAKNKIPNSQEIHTWEDEGMLHTGQIFTEITLYNKKTYTVPYTLEYLRYMRDSGQEKYFYFPKLGVEIAIANICEMKEIYQHDAKPLPKKKKPIHEIRHILDEEQRKKYEKEHPENILAIQKKNTQYLENRRKTREKVQKKVFLALYPIHKNMTPEEKDEFRDLLNTNPQKLQELFEAFQIEQKQQHKTYIDALKQAQTLHDIPVAELEKRYLPKNENNA